MNSLHECINLILGFRDQNTNVVKAFEAPILRNQATNLDDKGCFQVIKNVYYLKIKID